LRVQLQPEFLQQQAELGFGLGIAGEHQLAAVGGRQMHSIICMAANFSNTLRGVSVNANNTVAVPDRLYDNIQTDYALWIGWDWLMPNPNELPCLIAQANNNSKQLISNSRGRRLQNP
jgi:hypothetical protein